MAPTGPPRNDTERVSRRHDQSPTRALVSSVFNTLSNTAVASSGLSSAELNIAPLPISASYAASGPGRARAFGTKFDVAERIV